MYLKTLTLCFLAFLSLKNSEAVANPINCGPGTITYGLYASAGSTQPVGFRCIRFVDRNSFVWYGETNSPFSNKRIRELAYGLKGQSSFETKVVIIHGNGEEDRFPYNLPTGSYDDNFYINERDSSGWNADNGPASMSLMPMVLGAYLSGHILRRVGTLHNYTLLAKSPLKQCGSYLTEYKLADYPSHIRCTLNFRNRSIAAWIGAGEWSGTGYWHIGTAFFGLLSNAWGSSDLCLRSGYFCGKLSFGELNLEPQPGGDIFVSGAWNEIWRR